MTKTFTLTLAALMLTAPLAIAASDAFTKADADANGALSMAEVKAINPSVTEAAFTAADTDQDGALSPEEFAAAQATLTTS